MPPAWYSNANSINADMDTKVNAGSEARALSVILAAVEEGADSHRASALKSFGKELLDRVSPDFFGDHTLDEVALRVVELFDLLEVTDADDYAVRVRQRAKNGRSGSVEVVIGDRPFIVDTVRQHLTSKGFEIRHQLHPVVVIERDEDGKIGEIRDWRSAGRRISVVYTEFEGQLDPESTGRLEEELRACLEDLRLATDDFQAMLAKTDEISGILRAVAEGSPERTSEIEETVAFLKWLRDGGFVFLGYREYDFYDGSDRRHYAALVRGSGLGILRREERSSAWAPVALDDIPADIRGRALNHSILLVSKANAESRVHRRARMDYIGIRTHDGDGRVIRERRFLGLFTWQAYAENAANIPILRKKLHEILEGANVPKGSHDYKVIVTLFNEMPLEELFLVSVEDLWEQIAAVMASEDTGDVRLVLTPDALGRGVNVMVILPKANYTDEIRERLRSEIADALRGSVLNDHLSIGEGETARLHFYISASPERAGQADIEALNELVTSIVQTWKQRLRDALAERYDAESVHYLAATYFDAFSAAYVATVDVDTAVSDIERLEDLRRSGLMQVVLEDSENADLVASDLRLFVPRASMILADVMPVLENLGLRVIEADAMDVGSATIHTFVVQGPDSGRLERYRVGEPLEEAIRAIAAGSADNDRFNRLVITSGLSWAEVAVLRAYSEYAFQIGAVTSRRAAPDALTKYPEVARLLFEVFTARFGPRLEGDHAAAAETAKGAFRESLRAVESIADDLTLRRLHNLIEATVRTSYFANHSKEHPVPRTSFKFDCTAIQQMPYPRPAREMFVFGPRTAALHLRFGPVARGGLRWSERPDDFRTEVLGLVKTQQVKNAVIVPSGAKGAFLVRKPPSDRSAVAAAVEASYRDFIGGLLDVTDNIIDGVVVHPKDVVVYDGEDPYLVVAADKGTATFSDTANRIASEYNFWLGDGFASGGSNGYDHKKERITARGAWECVRHHFREMGTDVNSEPLTVVGIGDMSGDVFGNGMLLSRTIRLWAAFDHRHIFLDPDPDPEKSYHERHRLFHLAGSSWADYNRAVISEGGGVYSRGAKEIVLSPEARRLLGVEDNTINGQALIRAILRLPADLLWNGGIGTYVKAGEETNADVGDSSNDAVRVDAEELRVRVIGEGGNLGLTQRARIEYALAGGRLNTDAIDNSGGVDMSDREVNLKILLQASVDRGEMTQEDRNALLAHANEEVGELVLRNNRSQSWALSLEQLRADERLSDFRDAAYFLEKRAGLSRALEALPGWGRLQARQEAGKSMTRPELAVLLAYSKLYLKKEIIASTLPEDPTLSQLLRSYFPSSIAERTSDADLRSHRLQRDIIATVLTNRLVDLMGSTFLPRVTRDTGASPAALARGWHVASEIAGATELIEQLERNRERLPARQEHEWLLTLEGVLERTVRWAIEHLSEAGGIGWVIDHFKAPVAELCRIFPSIIEGSQRESFQNACGELESSGLPAEESRQIAALQYLEDLMAITSIGHELARSVGEVGRVYFALTEVVDFALLRELLEMSAGEDEWEQRAAQGLIRDLEQARRKLTVALLQTDPSRSDVEELLPSFQERNAARLQVVRDMLQGLLSGEKVSLAALTVATRETVRQSAAILEGRVR